jgi:hypothetical protein
MQAGKVRRGCNPAGGHQDGRTNPGAPYGAQTYTNYSEVKKIISQGEPEKDRHQG